MPASRRSARRRASSTARAPACPGGRTRTASLPRRTPTGPIARSSVKVRKPRNRNSPAGQVERVREQQTGERLDARGVVRPHVRQRREPEHERRHDRATDEHEDRTRPPVADRDPVARRSIAKGEDDDRERQQPEQQESLDGDEAHRHRGAAQAVGGVRKEDSRVVHEQDERHDRDRDRRPPRKPQPQDVDLATIGVARRVGRRVGQPPPEGIDQAPRPGPAPVERLLSQEPASRCTRGSDRGFRSRERSFGPSLRRDDARWKGSRRPAAWHSVRT